MTKPGAPLTAPRMISATAAIALAISLSGCGMFAPPTPDPAPSAVDPEPAETAGNAAAEGVSGEEGSSAAASPDTSGGSADDGSSTGAQGADDGSSATGAEGTGPASEDPFADSARTTSWAGDDSIEVDEQGNGIIPASSLEADLVDLFANKFDMTVKTAECERDMEVKDWYGFETCNVTDEEMTYYGTVKLIDHKGDLIKYEVLFPGIKAEDVDF